MGGLKIARSHVSTFNNLEWLVQRISNTTIWKATKKDHSNNNQIYSGLRRRQLQSVVRVNRTGAERERQLLLFGCCQRLHPFTAPTHPSCLIECFMTRLCLWYSTYLTGGTSQPSICMVFTHIDSIMLCQCFCTITLHLQNNYLVLSLNMTTNTFVHVSNDLENQWSSSIRRCNWQPHLGDLFFSLYFIFFHLLSRLLHTRRSDNAWKQHLPSTKK